MLRLAIPQDHGSWVFLISPLIIGLFITPASNPAQIIILTASLTAFLLRQPLSIWVKIISGRRANSQLRKVQIFSVLYLLIGLVCAIFLLFSEVAFLLFLVIPGSLIFIWHLYLVSLRKERNQMTVDIIASGSLALVAPAILWAGTGQADCQGVLLWLLCWLQSASSIVHIFMRLNQKDWEAIPSLNIRFKVARRNMMYAGFNILFSSFLSIAHFISPLMVLPYLLQFLESLYGSIKPAIGIKTTKIGLRQLIISSLFTILFILLW